MVWKIFDRLRTLGIMEIGFDGKIIQCNRGMAKLLGCDISEVCGKSKVDFIAPEDRFKAFQRLQGYMSGALDQAETETRMIKPNGARLWVSLESIVLKNDRGERTSILCLVFEIPNGEQASKVMELERKLEAVSDLVMQLAAARAGGGSAVINIGQTNVDDVGINGGQNVIGTNHGGQRGAM